MREKTTNRYIRTITRFLSFTLRAATGDKELVLNLSPMLLEKSRHLIEALLSQTQVDKAIHDLIFATLMELRSGGVDYDCPASRFIIYHNVLLSGQIRDVENVRGTLSELKWPFRASAFWEFLQRMATSANPDPDLYVHRKVCWSQLRYSLLFTLFQDHTRRPRRCSRRQVQPFLSLDGDNTLRNDFVCQHHPNAASTVERCLR